MALGANQYRIPGVEEHTIHLSHLATVTIPTMPTPSALRSPVGPATHGGATKSLGAAVIEREAAPPRAGGAAGKNPPAEKGCCQPSAYPSDPADSERRRTFPWTRNGPEPEPGPSRLV